MQQAMAAYCRAAESLSLVAWPNAGAALVEISSLWPHRLFIFEWLHLRNHPDLCGELEWSRRAIFVGQLGKEGGPTLLRLFHSRDINAAAFLFQIGALPRSPDGHQPKVPRLGVRRLPQLHRAWLVLALHPNRSIVLQSPRKLRQLRDRKSTRLNSSHLVI